MSSSAILSKKEHCSVTSGCHPETNYLTIANCPEPAEYSLPAVCSEVASHHLLRQLSLSIENLFFQRRADFHMAADIGIDYLPATLFGQTAD